MNFTVYSSKFIAEGRVGALVLSLTQWLGYEWEGEGSAALSHSGL